MATITVYKGNQTKVINIEHKKNYINAGWSENKQPTKVGVSSSNIKYGNNKY